MRTDRRVQFHRAIAVGAQALGFLILFLGHSWLEPRPKSMVAHFYFHLAQPILSSAPEPALSLPKGSRPSVGR